MKAGWEVKALGEVCQIKPPKSLARKSILDTDDVSFVPMSDLGELEQSFESRQTKLLGEVYGGYTYFAENDVLVAKITPCFENGKLGIARGLANGIGFGSSEFVAIRSSGAILPEYVFYFLYRNEFRETGAKIMTGAVGHKRVPEEYIRQLPIPLPPLDEQKRIVEVLDAAFEGLSRARAHTETNLQNARELFEGYVEDALAKSGGVPRTLQELLDDGSIISHLDGNHGGLYPKKSEFVSAGVPYISANCIDENLIQMDRCKFLTPERAATLRKGVAQNGDVIFAHNATVGPVALLETNEECVILSTSLTYYRCDPSRINPIFLMNSMRGAGFRRQYEAVMGQSTRNQVPITMQRTFFHTIPALEEQTRIAAACTEIEQSSRDLISHYRAKLADLDALRQALLQKAFAGELT